MEGKGQEKKKRKRREERGSEYWQSSKRGGPTRTLHQTGAKGEATFSLRKLIGALHNSHHVIITFGKHGNSSLLKKFVGTS